MAATGLGNEPAGTERRPVLSQSTQEALVHLLTAVLIVFVSVSAFAVNVVFGVAATFVVVLALATVLPASMPIVLVCAFLFQNVVIAWYTPFIPNNNDFDALRGANFVVLMTAYSAFFAASFQARLRAITGLRRWLLLAIVLSGVIGFYLALGAVHGTPKDAIIYFRNTITPLACFHIAVVAASLYRVELRKSFVWLGTVAIAYGYAELIFKLKFLSLFHGDLYVQRDLFRQIESGVWERTMHETGFVIRGLQDVLTTTFFNTPLFAGIFPDVFRISGPNFHPISYAYALGVLSTWLLFRRRWLLALAALPLLLVIGSKGAMFMVLVALAGRVMWNLAGPRVTAATVTGISILWVVAAIIYGSRHGDYHVLGMIAGIKGFLHDPFGQGLGLGGNLSSTTLHNNWQHAQRVGATSKPMESALGVMLYQMGIGSFAFLGFLATLAVSAYRLLVKTRDLDFLFSFVVVVALSANAVLQEEAYYSPLALGFCMLLIGTAFGNHFRRALQRPAGAPPKAAGRPGSRRGGQDAGRMF